MIYHIISGKIRNVDKDKRGSVMVIRESDRIDVEGIHELIQLNLSTVNSKDYPSEVISFMKSYYSLKNIEKWIDELRISLVAESDTEIVGCIMLDEKEIKGLYVHPDMHSRGIGKKLVDTLESKIVGETLILYASLTAHKFYESLDYTNIEMVDDTCVGKLRFHIHAEIRRA